MIYLLTYNNEECSTGYEILWSSGNSARFCLGFIDTSLFRILTSVKSEEIVSYKVNQFTFRLMFCFILGLVIESFFVPMPL